MKKIQLCLALISIVSCTQAQFDYSKKLSGLMIRTGFSNSLNENTGSLTNYYPAASFGIYRYFNLVKKNESLIPFHYLKAELNLGTRTGLFKINDLGQTASVSTQYFEVLLLAPLTWEITDHLAANIGVGAGISFKRGQSVSSDIIPTPVIKEGNSVKGNIHLDYHLLFVGRGSALIGARFIIDPAQYGYAEWSIYFGFSLPHAKKIKLRATTCLPNRQGIERFV